MVGFMRSPDDSGGQSSGKKRRRNYRHSLSQTDKLEAYFKNNQHPNERDRCSIGREVGLTPTQIKFWFQNKRTLSKVQTSRMEGNNLKAENERIRYENYAILESLSDGLCITCKGLSSSTLERQRILDQLKIENSQLNEEYYRLTNFMTNSENVLSDMNSQGAFNGSIPQFPSLFNDFNLNNLSFEPTWEQKPNTMQEFDLPRMVQMVTNAIEEFMALMTKESLWLKDPTNEKYVIHRPNYEKTFLRNSYLSNSSTRLESSKKEGVVRMSGTQLVAMLHNSFKRMDLFPTIITKAMTLQPLEPGFGGLIGTIQLVYEQIHILSPLLAPREFDLIRYTEQIDDGSWIIVDMSHNLFNNDKSPFHSWKFPSGCLIKDLSNGFSKITWVEHMEVDGIASLHHLYREVVSRGWGYGADRFIFNLQRMCDRLALNEDTMAKEVGVIIIPEGRRSIMNLTQNMMKDLCTKLSTKTQVEVPHLSQINYNETRVNVYKNNGPGQPNGMIISATTSLWIPFSYQDAFSFLTNAKKRNQWDAFSNEFQHQEIASITYGNDVENRISIIQPIMAGEINTLVIQESCLDLEGGIIVYAPIQKQIVDMLLSGEDSSGIPITSSGFIISNDGRAHASSRDGASSSTASPNGSILTVVLQISSCEGSDFEEVNALISSTMQKIKFSLSSNNE